ncbi:MAG: hypothetical protein HUU46_23565 [Candidatus Hydrogenedentes bacterium]|nr:hypothetical protein [Candidatus Hydrogenedentota bacterium]
MKRMHLFRTVIAAVAVCLLASGCPDGALGTFDLYIINATNNRTIGLVGLDNHEDPAKELVDVLDENIPPDTMRKLTPSVLVYGDESGSVQIGIVNVGFESIGDVPLGPEAVAILVEDDGEDVSLRLIEVQ